MDENNTQTTENTGSTENTGATQENNQSNGTATETVKTFTQAEVDALIEKRLARERKKFQQQGTNNTAQGQQEQTTDTTGAGTTQVEVDVTEDARQQANAIIAQANQRLIQAVAQSEATKLNINPEYIADAVRLADLSKVTVGDDGTIDTKSVTAALEAVLERMPILKAAVETPTGGFKVGGQGGNNNTSNGWSNNSSKNSGEAKRWNKNRY